MDDKPHNMNVLRHGKLYRTESAMLLASGSEGGGGGSLITPLRLIFLFRTSRGNYFVQYQWDPSPLRNGHLVYRDPWSPPEEDELEPLTQDKAIEMFQTLQYKKVDFKTAFPNIEAERHSL